MIFADYPGHLIFLFLFGFILLTVYIIFRCTARPITKAAKTSFILILAVLSTLLLLLLEPSEEKAVFRTQNSYVSVFIDTSRSMSIRDGARSRFDNAKSAIEDNLFEKYKEVDWKLYGFDSSYYRVNEAAELKPDGDKTELISVLRHIQNTVDSGLTAGRLEAAFVFTDACTAENLEEFNKTFTNIPVKIIDVSENKTYPDVEIANVIYPPETVQNAPLDITLLLKAKNYAEKAELYIYHDNILEQIREVSFAEQDTRREKISLISDKQGLAEITLRAEPAKDEIDLHDNERTVYIRTVPAEKVKVLFYAEKLNFDIGKIKQILTAHKNIDLDLRLNVLKQNTKLDEKSGKMNRSFPEDRLSLNKYDLIIFGQVDFTEMNDEAISNIVSFITQKGGGVIFLPARDKTYFSANNGILRDIMPVYFEDIEEKAYSKIERPNNPDRFETHFYDTITIPVPPYDYNINPKPASKVMMNDNGSPIVLFHQYGNGCVCYINTFQLYQAYDNTGVNGGGGLGKILTGLIPVMTFSAENGYVRVPRLRQSDLPGTYFAEALLRQQNKPVNNAEVLAALNDKTFIMENTGRGLYRAKIDNVRNAVFELNFIAGRDGDILTQKTRKYSFPKISDEMDNLTPDKNRLKKFCGKINADYVEIDKTASISYNNIGRPVLKPVRTGLERIWDRWAVLVFICGLLSINWFIRKRYL